MNIERSHLANTAWVPCGVCWHLTPVIRHEHGEAHASGGPVRRVVYGALYFSDPYFGKPEADFCGPICSARAMA